jgi:anti-sigma regulatory factor (Ser/Thr protein kinase)
MVQQFQRCIANRLDELSDLMAAVEGFLQQNGAGGELVYTTNLALEEMVTNTIKYGYDDKLDHEILVGLEWDGSSLRLRIEDDGHEFDPCQAPEPDTGKDLDDMAIGGLGIHLVREMAEAMTYTRSGDRNLLEITIR